MAFGNPTSDLLHYKALAASALRKGVPHPDLCPKLKIHGAAWAIPPRGQRVVPQINDAGAVTGIVADTADTWPEIAALQAAIKLPADVVCPTCGQATGTTVTVTEEVLTAAFALAARALLAHYDLAPVQLADLLAFEDSGAPEWLHPLLRWSSGLPAESAEATDVQDLPDWASMMDAFSSVPDPSPPAPERTNRWWQFWRTT